MCEQKQKPFLNGSGLILFDNVADAISAEKVLKSADYVVRLVAPPPALRKGCDLALEINLTEQLGIERLLKQTEATYTSIEPVTTTSSGLLQIVKVTDYGQWLMVKAGNMKLTFDKKNGHIVNTSGGGCPDIPYLHAELIGKQLSKAPRPKDIGFTLCALMLDRALEECLALWQGGKQP